MRQLLALLALLLPLPAAVQPAAEKFVMEPGPKSPEDSLKCIQVRPGFKVELMASEPAVQSPIAFAWGADAKFWVVEMGDYPLGVDGKGKGGGKIKTLTKSRPDGPYDQATVFLDGLSFPTGVFPYKKGVLVTCAPDIFYAEDTDGDGKADKREVLFTGFKEGNQQHRVNGLVWGLDNWIYGANGESGGVVKSLKTGKEVDIRGRDFRLKPDTGEFEAVTGQSQFGRCRDDWGNWFGCTNANPLFHYVLDDHYLRRNPHVRYPDPRVNVSETPGPSRVYPISKPLPRFNNPQSVNHFTSACSAIIYRDNLFGPEFEGNSFVSEPVHNLIHREILMPKGVTFTSRRADDEKESEFLASSDNWFRPTMLATGPDGALWVADMYRYVIEHPEWIPKDWQKKLDLRAGQDKGRIYRVYPVGKKPRDIPRIDKMRAKDVLKELGSPNGWTRDAAQQALFGNQFKNRMEVVQAVTDLMWSVEPKERPLTRLHALFALGAGVERIGDFALSPMLPEAIRSLEGGPGPDIGDLRSVLHHSSPRAHLQLAFSLGSWKGAGAAEVLVELLCSKTGEEPYIRAAALSSITATNRKLVLEALARQPMLSPAIFQAVGPAVDVKSISGPAKGVVRYLASKSGTPAESIAPLVDALDALDTHHVLLSDLLRDCPAADRDRIQKIYKSALELAANPEAPLATRALSIRVLSRGMGNDREDYRLLLAMLNPRSPDDLQAAVLQTFANRDDPRIPELLKERWKTFSPRIRGVALDAMLTHATWTHLLLRYLENKDIPAAEIDAIRRQRLLQSPEPDVKTQAAKLFAASSTADRTKVFNDYWLRLPEKADAAKGAKIFAKSCAACHKLGDVGQNVGPDLASLGDKTPQGLLTAILDPNRAVEARYVNYTATTKAGKIVTGMIQNETSTTITLVGPDGKAQQLLRNELDEVLSTGTSLMPEGLEREHSPQDLADLIEFIRNDKSRR